MKARSESIEAIMQREADNVPGFVAHMEDTRLPKYVVRDLRKTGGGCGLLEGPEENVDGVSPGRPQTFR